MKKDVNGEGFEVQQLLQSDANRAANLAMSDNLESLSRLLNKLYKRNPKEWKKSGATTREGAHKMVMEAIVKNLSLPVMKPYKSVAALSLALTPNFSGDRAGAMVYGIGSMLMEAYGGKVPLNLLNGLSPQKLANASLNIEVAAWMLNNRSDAQGQPLLLANEISPKGRNLSFEREFGRIIGRLELLAQMNNENLRRTGINYFQGILAAPIIGLVQFIPLDAVAAAVP